MPSFYYFLAKSTLFKVFFLDFILQKKKLHRLYWTYTVSDGYLEAIFTI